MTTGNLISVIGFSLCALYFIVLMVFYFIKRHKAKKEIKKAGKKNEERKKADKQD